MDRGIRLFALAVVMLPAIVAAEDPLPTAKELALRLRQYQSSIKTLQVRYRTRQLPAKGISNEGEAYISEGTPWRELLWVKDGRKEYLGEFPEEGAPLNEIKLIASYDGKQGYKAVYSQIDRQSLRSIVIGKEKPDDLLAPFPRLLGWSIPFVNDTLISLLERPGDKPISWSDRFDERCLQCDLGYLSEGLGSEHVVKAWFDPAEDWLPRLIVILPRAIDEAALAGKPIPQPVSPFVFSMPPVDTFLAGQDALAEIPRKFPAVCRQKSAESDSQEAMLEVSHVEFNAGIDRSLFKPDIPRGTEIIRNQNTPQETRQIVGNAADAKRFEERLADEERRRPDRDTLPPKQTPSSVDETSAVSARPSDAARSIWSSPVLWITSAVVLLVVAGFLKRLG